MQSNVLRWVSALTLLTIAYWILAVIGLKWAVVPGAGSSVWPAAGLGVAALIVGGRQLWPAILLGRLLTALSVGSPQPFWADFAISSGNALATYLAVAWLQRGGRFASGLSDLRGTRRFILIGGGAHSALAAVLGAVALIAAGSISFGEAWSTLEGWALGNFVGVLTVGAFILAWWNAKPSDYRLSQWGHLAAALGAAAVISSLLFLQQDTITPRSWMAFIVIAWAAIAFHARGATAALLVTSAIAVAGSALELGLFTYLGDTKLQAADLLQQFMAGVGIAGLLLASLARERSEQEAVRRSNARLAPLVEQLRESEERLRFAQRAARAVTWEYDVPSGVTRWGDVEAIRELAGESLSEVTPLREWTPLLHPEDRESYFAQWEQRLREGQGRIAFRISRQGEVRWIEVIGRVTERGSDGEPRRLTGISLDVTERMAAEARLRTSEARLRLALDAGRLAVWEHEPATDTLHASAELNRLLGYPPEARLEVQELRARFRTGDRERVAQTAQEALAKGERYFEAEFRFQRPDGALRWFLIRAEIEIANDGSAARTTGVLLDVTSQKSAEEALREREADLQAALHAGSLATVDLDHRTGMFSPSPRLAELFGYPPDHVLTLADLRGRYHPEDLDEVIRIGAAAEADPAVRNFQWSLRLLLPDGRIRWIDARGEYLRDEDGRVVRSRGVMIDITERKRWEEHQRLLINELNHRVKNTLAVVQSLARQTLKRGTDPEQARLALEARLTALSAAHNLITQQNWEGASLHEVVRDSVNAATDLDGPRVKWDGPAVQLSPQRAVSVALAVHELCTNATKYGALSSPGGSVEVAWRLRSEPDGGEALLFTWRERGGPPVAPPTRRGFGMRLLSHGLANELGADIKVEFPPEGVVFTLRARLSDGPSKATASPQPAV